MTRALQGRGWGAGMQEAVGPMGGKDEVSRREQAMNEWALVDDEEVGLVGSPSREGMGSGCGCGCG